MADDETTDHVLVERDDAVGRITLNRPDAHNALDEAMARDLHRAVEDLATDDDVRCIAMTGSGGTFCTGADLGQLHGDDTDARRLRGIANHLHGAVWNVVRAPKPVVTAVNGVVAGGGLGLSLSGDVVVASDEARFEYAYPRIGLSGDGGSTWLLPRLVGRRTARDIVFLDRPIAPDEAVEVGLATEVTPHDDLEDRVAELTDRLASGPTRAYAETKRLLDESHRRGLKGQLAKERETIAGLAATDDWERGHAAFFSDEDPEFEGR